MKPLRALNGQALRPRGGRAVDRGLWRAGRHHDDPAGRLLRADRVRGPAQEVPEVAEVSRRDGQVGRQPGLRHVVRGQLHLPARQEHLGPGEGHAVGRVRLHPAQDSDRLAQGGPLRPLLLERAHRRI